MCCTISLQILECNFFNVILDWILSQGRRQVVSAEVWRPPYLKLVENTKYMYYTATGISQYIWKVCWMLAPFVSRAGGLCLMDLNYQKPRTEGRKAFWNIEYCSAPLHIFLIRSRSGIRPGQNSTRCLADGGAATQRSGRRMAARLLDTATWRRRGCGLCLTTQRWHQRRRADM